jgi:hypothetical protein
MSYYENDKSGLFLHTALHIHTNNRLFLLLSQYVAVSIIGLKIQLLGLDTSKKCNKYNTFIVDSNRKTPYT